ncbi:MAG: DUF2817 domain-containing protein [Actinomycetota bacterium]
MGGWSRRRVVSALGAGAAAAATIGLPSLPTTVGRAGADDRPASDIRTTGRARDRARRDDPPSRFDPFVESAFGTSHEGRPIIRWVATPPAPRVSVVVVLGIHGNERITLPLAASLMNARRPNDVKVTIVPAANPDGWANRTRRNAQGVDLNRNFPWRWSRSTGGPGPGSAPETKAMMRLIEDERPDLCVWVHQPLAYVGPIGDTPRRYAERWAQTVGDRVRLGIDQHGGGETWANRVVGSPSLLVEVATWDTREDRIWAHTQAFSNVLEIVTPTTR